MCCDPRGGGFGYARQQSESGHDTPEPTQLNGIQFQSTVNQRHGQWDFSENEMIKIPYIDYGQRIAPMSIIFIRKKNVI